MALEDNSHFNDVNMIDITGTTAAPLIDFISDAGRKSNQITENRSYTIEIIFRSILFSRIDVETELRGFEFQRAFQQYTLPDQHLEK